MLRFTPCVLLCLLAISVAMTAGLQADASDQPPATNIEQPVPEDAAVSNEEEMSDARAGAIVIFWIVSFVLFFISIKRLVQFWAIALVLASMGVVMTIEDVLMGIVVFVVVLGTLMWLGVKELLGRDGEG